MLKQRIITALILIPIVIWGFFYLDGGCFALFTGAVVSIGSWEWARLIGIHTQLGRCVYAFCVAIFLLILWCNPQLSKLIIVLGVMWWGVACLLVTGFPDTTVFWRDKQVFKYVIGLLILVPAWQGLILLKQLPSQANRVILTIMVFVWIADSGAYFVGRQWGQTKLAPKVSPGKSWEGCWGGLLAVLFAAILINSYSKFVEGSWLLVILCVVIFTVFSVIGDLTESMFKREAGIKDSSNLLPGHGGILDRIDSLTAAIPVAIMLLWALGLM